MRPTRENPPGTARRGSNTPIYDSLYAEYQRLFRTLPGDRTGEESLLFQGFGTTLHSSGLNGSWRTERRARGISPPAALPPARGERRDHES